MGRRSASCFRPTNPVELPPCRFETSCSRPMSSSSRRSPSLGAWSAWRLEEVGAVSQRILSENYESVVAAQNMKESLERQDSAALFAQLGQTDRARRQLEEHRRRFDAAFARAEGNITEPGEEAVIAAIRRGRDEYYRAFNEHADYFGAARTAVRQAAQRCRSPAAAQPGGDAAEIRRREPRDRSLADDDADLVSGTCRHRAWASPSGSPLRSNDEADRLKSEFVGIASHELRTPLMTLRMGIDLINEQLGPNATEREREILAMCREDAARLERLITDLLDLSRIESGRIQPTLATVAATTLVQEALAPGRPRIEASGINLQVEYRR